MRPRLLVVGRTRFTFPLGETLQRRFDALSAELEWRQLGAGRSTDERFALAPPFPIRRLDGFAFYLALPFRVARELRRFRPDGVIAQGLQETALVLLARALARVPAKVIADVHGDWRAPTRLYGSPARRLLDPLADVLARIGLRRADGIRTISGYTTGLVRASGREPDAEFPAYMDLEPFLGPAVPLPEAPTALFVGVLERYKAIDVLAAAWPGVRERVPEARLHVVGSGSLSVPAGEGITWSPSLPTAEVAAALDAATLLVLPSRSEGMGRVLVEAFCRGRGVVGSRVGGIPDLVRDGENGLLVPPADAAALADELARVLGDPELADRLGRGALASAPAWIATPEEFARRLRVLVEQVTRLSA
ncbi:MAG: glycosyltransferase family 4 protein [Gaiellaceae bacterium MAG52_C11]|nr:glycosyltransferase family 4 protein [Candidatus Gaiellasilicea maunaloa]